ncbi:MAG: DMT family transporter [Bdellovibrionales bacterium]|nr:DMT family transporter [Bdellovibrionales bacterium]
MTTRPGKTIAIIASCFAGVLLASMVFLNSKLASMSSPMISSVIVHLMGTLACMFILGIQGREPLSVVARRSPLWSYGGGVLGATVVVLCNITVNSSIGLSGTVSMMLLGQTIFSALADHYAWLGLEKKKLKIQDVVQIFLILCGCMILLFWS